MKYKYIKCQLEALEGKFLWHWLIKKNHEIQDTLVILFPSKGTKYNQYALQYLEELLKKRQRKINHILKNTPRSKIPFHKITTPLQSLP